MNRSALRLAAICGFVLVLTFGSSVAAQPSSWRTITLVLQVPPFQLVTADDSHATIQAEGCAVGGQPGQAMLPHQTIDVALPPDVDWDSLSLSVRDVRTEAIPGSYQLPTAVPDQTSAGASADPVQLPSAEPTTVRILSTGQMRKWRLAQLDFAPFQYEPASGQIRVVEWATVELRFARTGDAPNAALLADDAMDDVAAARFANYEQALAWYPQVEQVNQTHDYVIITTNAIANNSTKLAAFVMHKQARGHDVLVITQDQYGPLTGQPPDGRAEKVRQWLVNNYASMGIEYVLLIGDPAPGGSGLTDLPMQMCWPRWAYADYRESPTDYFFADLTGNWDADGDTNYGEFDDDYYGIPGGVDLNAEVYVGRIPFYGDYVELDHILQKTIDYENALDTGWRESALLPMSFSTVDYDGAWLAERMMGDYLDPAGFTHWTQYQQGGGACGLDSSYPSDQELRGGTVVRDRWAANDYGVVTWWGHGSATSVSVGCDGCWDGTLFNSSQTSSLDDTHPALTYQCSCNNGTPENSGNLGYSLLVHGAIATVSASRVSWFNTGENYATFPHWAGLTNAALGYYYVQGLVQDGQLPGEALYAAKASMAPVWETRLMNYYDMNLYGDPAVGEFQAEVFLAPPEQAGFCQGGSAVTYTLQLTNLTGATDSFSLTIQPGNTWTTTLSLTRTGALSHGDDLSFAVRVEVPLAAAGGATDSATVQATSVASPAVFSDTATISTTATVVRGVVVHPPAGAQSGRPSETVTYTLRVTNTGNSGDTFDVAVSGNYWTTNVPLTVGPLSAGEGTDVEVAVDIPAGAGDGDFDVATVTVTSQGDANVSASSDLTTTASRVCGLTVSPSSDAQSGDPGDTVTYTLRVTNTGDCSDTFDIAVSANAWTTTFPATVGPLAAGQGIDMEVSVDIPGDAQCGDNDTAAVTFTSQGDGVTSASSVLTTSTSAVFGVAVHPLADAQSGDPGTTVTYTLRLTNTGNCSDTFNITVSGNVWVTAVTLTVGPLAAGAGIDDEITVEIPAGAKDGDSDVATVTFASQGDGSVSATSVLTTTALISEWKVYLPLVFKSHTSARPLRPLMSRR